MKFAIRPFLLILGAAALLLSAPAFAGHGLPYHASVDLDGSQEVPTVQTDLSGNCVVILEPGVNMLSLSCAFPTAPMAAHIHQGSVGENGPVILTLDSARVIQQSFTLTEEQVTAATIGDLYINFHTVEVPSGEIRGQIIFNQVPNTWSMIADGSGADEATPNDTDNSVECRAFAAEGEPTNLISVQCLHDVDDATAAHLHIGTAGSDGPVVEGFDSPESPLSKLFQVDDATLQAFMDGNTYVNVHNDAFPGGIVRAQFDNAVDSDTTAALQDGRFQVEVTGASRFGPFTGQATRESDSSASFTFFTTDNVELTGKVLNFCNINGSYGVFLAAMTDTEFDYTVTDTQTGNSMTYSNELGTPAESVIDFNSFRDCP